jgi:hypothetical protein
MASDRGRFRLVRARTQNSPLETARIGLEIAGAERDHPERIGTAGPVPSARYAILLMRQVVLADIRYMVEQSGSASSLSSDTPTAIGAGQDLSIAR